MMMRARLLVLSCTAAMIGGCRQPAAPARAAQSGFLRIEALVVDSAARLVPGCNLAVELRGADANGIVATDYAAATDSQGFYRQTDSLAAVYPRIQVRLVASHLGRTDTRVDTTQLWLWDPPGDTLRLVLQLH